MHELDRHMLRIGRMRPSTEREQPPAAEEPLRHLLARLRQRPSLAGEERGAHTIALEQIVLDRRPKCRAGQHIRGSGSPTSMSTIRLPP
jgi:hypothetical protein